MVSSGSPSHSSNPGEQKQQQDQEEECMMTPSNPNRRPNNKRKRHVKRQQAIQKKVETLRENLKPIPFVPSKALDFEKHENLLKRLGLWDFVHINLDGNIRVDLIAQLIGTYDSKGRCSYVNDYRIGVNRADLARALKLPVKKDKCSSSSSSDSEVVSFMEEFLSSWVLLHEDTWILTGEVLNWTRAIKEGHLDKVDWATLFWSMLDKELLKGEHLVDCYYASHLQCLIKFQREELFTQDNPTEEEEEEEEEEQADLKLPVVSTEQSNFVSDEPHPHIESSLGQDNSPKEEDIKNEDMMIEEENRQWILEGKNSFGDHFMQPCNLEKGMLSDMNEGTKLEVDQEIIEAEEEEEQRVEEAEDRFNIAPNQDTLERDGLTGNLLQAMETTQIPFDFHGQVSEQTPVELHSSRDETHTIFSIGGKREMEHADDISHHSLDGGNKRLRTDDHDRWDDRSPEFGVCMDQSLHWIEKARMAYQAKEATYQESNMNQQILLNEYQRRDTVMEHMLKNKCEEMQKKNIEMFRLERELFAMVNLIDGYRKALKETNKAFFEYRQRCQLPEEPFYKDAGPGGLVLSTTELEKQRQKQEEENGLNRIMIEQKFKDVEKGYIGKFEEYLNTVTILDDRLMDFENKVKLLKERSAKSGVSEEEDPEEVPDVLEANDATNPESSL